jgi:integrase
VNRPSRPQGIPVVPGELEACHAWRTAIIEIGRPSLRVHDLRHTYASLARRAGADLRLLEKTMGHASITVTAHIYADLYDDELDDIASALDALDESRGDLP